MKGIPYCIKKQKLGGNAVKNQPIFQEIARKLKNAWKMVFMYLVKKSPFEYDLADEFQCSRLDYTKPIELLISQNILVKKKEKAHMS